MLYTGRQHFRVRLPDGFVSFLPLADSLEQIHPADTGFGNYFYFLLFGHCLNINLKSSY